MASDSARLLGLLPAGYLVATRIGSVRDAVHLLATSIVPPLFILLCHVTPSLDTLAQFALGYLAFISIYELGYLANDHWGAQRETAGRHRLSHRPAAAWIVLFVAIRIMVWALAGWVTEWLFNPVWLIGYAGLGVAFGLHNWLTDPGFRLASFSQLAILRFVMPILAAVPVNGQVEAIISAALLYLPLRLLSYADSKGVMNLPTRRSSGFAASYLALSAPVPLVVAALLTSLPLATLVVYYVAIFAGNQLLRGQADNAQRYGSQASE